MSTPEARTKLEITEWLKAAGYFFLRINSGIVKVRGGFMHLAPEGTADVLIFKGAEIFWCEIKAPGQATAKKRKAAQAAFREKVLAEGHRHAICSTVEEVNRLLNAEVL